jgi:hypothetical protein
MKHLKTYKIFESYLYDKKFKERYGIYLQDLKDTCKDILQELTDEGYDPYVGVNDDTIIISIDGPDDYRVFTIEEMEEHISRLEKYIGEFGYKEWEPPFRHHSRGEHRGDWRDYVRESRPSGNLVIIYKRTGIASI